jgi:hypothetical protein
MNVVSAPKPWATGIRGTSLSRGRRRDGNGSASRLAIISSVISVLSVGTIPPDPPAASPWGTHFPGPATPPGPASPPSAGTMTGYGVHRVTVQTPRAMAAATSATPSQASGSQPVLRKPIQIASPVRAAVAWPNTTAGGTPTPVARCRRRPPRTTQVRSM